MGTVGKVSEYANRRELTGAGRLALSAIGFVTTAGILFVIPITVLEGGMEYPYAKPGTWPRVVGGPGGLGFFLMALWLTVLVGGLWFGVRRSDWPLFRGAFLGSVVFLAGCLGLVIFALAMRR